MTDRPRSIEFLIVGGGPAGSAAACVLAAAGREVVVVERSTYDAPRVGETLPPAANPVLARLGFAREGLSPTALPCPGTVCSWGGDELYLNDYLFDEDGDGLHVDRSAFDRALAETASRAGAEVFTSCALRSCRLERTGCVVKIATPAGAPTFQVSTLIDAAGRRSWPGRPTRRAAFDRQVALVGMFASHRDDESVDGRTWVEAASDGWWYSAALPSGHLAAVYFTDADLLRGPEATRADRWSALLEGARGTRERLREASLVSAPRVVAASCTLADPITSERYIAVGDAASTLDPLSSQGILYALTSGIDAAEALLDPDRARACDRYAKAIVDRFRDDLQTLRAFHRAERRWPDSPFWRRRHRMRALSSAHPFDDFEGAAAPQMNQAGLV